MIIQKIELHNFKNFKDREFLFEPMNFIKGQNGSGKTTIALESILFCLYGFTPKEKLSDLPTRNIAKSCSVKIEIFHNNKGYRIIRKYPTHLSISENNKELIFTNSRDAQEFIDKTFGDRLNFMKFRIIDSNVGSNFLEEGQVALKKILFSNSDELFNTIRNKLNEVKYEREMYCLSGGTRIYTPKGSIRIKDMKIGDKVYSYNVINKKIDISSITKIYKTTSQKRLKIYFDNNTSIESTLNHPFAKKTTKQYRFTKAKSLRKGDIVYTYKDIGYGFYSQDKHQKNNFKLGYIWGYILGDGTKQKYSGYIINSMDIEGLNRIKNYIYLLYRRNVKIKHTQKWFTLYIPKDISISFDFWQERRMKLKEYQRGLISGFFDAEGNCSFNTHKGWKISIVQYNFKLLKYIQKILNKFNINSKISKNKHYLLIGNKYIYNFFTIFTPAIKRKYPKLSILANGLKIIKIIEKVNKKLGFTNYNFTCEPYNNYFAHKVLVHNCKDKAIIYPYYPSELRLETLEIGENGINSELVKLNRNLEPLEREYIRLTNQKSKESGDINYWKNKKQQLEENKSCYACKRGLTEEKQKEMITEVDNKIEELEISVQKVNKDEITTKEQCATVKTQTQSLTKRIYKIKGLISKLNVRLQQKNYKYTTKDVLIVKKAIEELDKLSSYYVTESLQILEPIINNIVNKIGFEVRFIINDKGKFAIELQKDNISYKYKDLSCGEKTILQIAFKLALLLERNEEGIIIADEGLSSLDEDNLLHVVNIFQDIPFQLFLVLHNAPELPQNIKVINLNKEK